MTLDLHLDQHSINASRRYSLQATLNKRLGWQSVECDLFSQTCHWVFIITYKSVSTLPTIDWLCQVKYQMSINWMSIKSHSRCQWSVDQEPIEVIDWHTTVDAFCTHDPIPCSNLLDVVLCVGSISIKDFVFSKFFHVCYTYVNNCITKMVVGCLRHPGASTIGSHLVDEDCSHGWQMLATQPWAPMQ